MTYRTQHPPDEIQLVRHPGEPTAQERVRVLMEQRYARLIEADFARMREQRAKRRARGLLHLAACALLTTALVIAAWYFSG